MMKMRCDVSHRARIADFVQRDLTWLDKRANLLEKGATSLLKPDFPSRGHRIFENLSRTPRRLTDYPAVLQVQFT